MVQQPSALELDDGNIVVIGQSRAQLFVLRSDGTDSAEIGRAGGDIGEFRIPVTLAALRDGQFGVVDVGLQRFTVFDGDLSALAMYAVPITHAAESATRLADGRWLSLKLSARVGDSVPLMLSDTDSSPPRAIALLNSPPTVFIERGDMGFNVPVEYGARDVWGALPSGSIWIARAGDNSVEWVLPDGSISKRQGLPVEAIKTKRGDLRRWHGQPAPASWLDLERPMAQIKSPFQQVVATPSGSLWYWMNQPDGYTSERYQCRTRDDAWGAAVQVAYGSRLLSIGANAAYFHEFGESGEERLVAYKLPACGS